jgi:hypothetical protein
MVLANLYDLRKAATYDSSCAGRPQQSMRISSWGIIALGTYALNPNYRRSTMKVSRAVDFHLQHHRANSKKKYGQDQ